MDNQEGVLRNDALLDALAAFREDQNGTTEQAFIQALIEAVFIAPVNFSEPPIIKEDGDVEIPEGAEMRLLTFEMENGHSVFPIFTDLDAFNAQPIDSEEPVHPWAMALTDYLPVLQNEDSENLEGLALNPFHVKTWLTLQVYWQHNKVKARCKFLLLKMLFQRHCATT